MLSSCLALFAANAQAQYIGGTDITPSTALSQDSPFKLAQIADGISTDTSPFNGFASRNLKSGTITLALNGTFNLTSFDLWSDIDVRAEGIDSFQLEFYSATNTLISTSVRFAAENGTSAKQTFNFPTVTGVSSVKLVVLSVYDSNYGIEIREVGFNGERTGKTTTTTTTTPTTIPTTTTTPTTIPTPTTTPVTTPTTKPTTVPTPTPLTTSNCDCIPHAINGNTLTASSNLKPEASWVLAQITDGINTDITPFNGFVSRSVTSGTIALALDGKFDLTSFDLWNDVNVNAEGIKEFKLEFYNAANTLISSSTQFTATKGTLDKQTFGFPSVADVSSVKLVVLSVYDPSAGIEIREVGFNGTKSDCKEKTIPSFNAATNMLSLPIVEVPTFPGNPHYKVDLKMVMVGKTATFVLQDVNQISASGTGYPSFSSTTGLVTIPFVYAQTVFGGMDYKATLTLVPDSNPLTFTLTNAELGACDHCAAPKQ
ncbi:MAG: hypothetical protein HOP02_09940 [Methylococcaceae bacterium]|nr:hypothetical protein [Methylococcaceae bacterium]